MGLFQNSVQQKYLNLLDASVIDQKYADYKSYFGNPTIQENIRNNKEEQYQEGFLRDLFVHILGYTLNPAPGFNLTTEYKNVKDAKKADGAILISDGTNTQVVGVIELKGTNTTDLGKIESQAFGYKNNQPDCVYVITSNFEKLRFYIDNAIEFIEFNLFNLTRRNFELLYLCLSYISISKGIPKTIKNESVSHEDVITKKLYRDYSLFRKELHQNLLAQNPQFDTLIVFKKAQKLLDRFLFLFFAEDRQLLPPNSVRLILDQWKKLQELDEYTPLYSRFKKYFGYLNTGFKGQRYDVFAYNGGLFKPDEILDSVTIDDDLLYRHTMALSQYDFVSEVDVNILGHIFENSLNEFDEIKAQLDGQEVDRSKTKRKKDGVFYTPKYITKYIVENTIGKLCTEKKAELLIDEEDYTTDRKRTIKTKQALLDKLNAYTKWLLQMTICDPACGSGAFLNQALDFLITEHKYIDELKAKLTGASIIFSDIEKSILENNLFGVDLNEESVEIAKLSLWLRTAQPNRKLNDLNNNIKCGNSLIDDPAVAGAKAFNWQQEFPQVFEKGGFDVVIGNPPYLRVQGLREYFETESKFYETHYISATGRFDIYVLFLEKAFQLIHQEGKISFILPHKFMVSDFGEGIRNFLIENKAIDSLVHFGSEMVFDDASTYTCIIGLSHNNNCLNFQQVLPSEVINDFSFEIIDYRTLNGGKWNLNGEKASDLFDKIYKHPLTAKDVFKAIRTGVDTGEDDLFILQGNIVGNKFIGYSEKKSTEIEIESILVKPLINGKDVKRYSKISHNNYVIYPHYEVDGKTLTYEEDELKNKFPLAYNYFLPFKEELIKRKIYKKTNPKYWYSLHRSREMSIFEQERIITPETSLGGNMSICNNLYYHNTQVYSLIKNEEFCFDYKYLISILNSNLFWFYLKNTGAVLRGGYFRFKTKALEPFPIPKVDTLEEQNVFIEKADLMLSLNQDFQTLSQRFQRTLQRKFGLEDLSGKLQNWYLLSYKEMISELGKKKVKLSLSEEAEWEEYFLQESRKALELKARIEATDKQIDRMVYELYGLTEEEIAIVEG